MDDWTSCDVCIHFTAYDDGDGRWDCYCEIFDEWTNSDGYSWLNDKMKDLKYALKCKHFIDKYKEEE